MSYEFYSEYVNHCLRFYARYEHPALLSDVDKRNWEACDNALREFTDREQDTLLTIYRGYDTLTDNIYQLARKQGVSQNSIWKLVKVLKKKVAEQRGLL